MMGLVRGRGWLLALLVSCARTTPAPVTPPRAPSPPTPVPPSFGCRGAELRRDPETEPARTVASGRLVVQRLPLPPADDREGEAPLPFGGVRLRVVAEAIPLPRFAAALSEALRVGVVVSPEAFGLQVTLASPDMTAASLLRVLRGLGLAWELDAGGVLRLQTRERAIAHALAQAVHPEPTETIMFAPVPGVPFDRVAGLLCDLVASPRGRVDVVAGHLIVQDVPRQMDLFRRMVDSVTTARDASAAASSPPFSCHGPERTPPPTRVRRSPVPSGRLVVQRLALPAATPAPRGEDDPPAPPFAGVRLRVVAEAAPLAPFAVALSEALRVGVMVPPESHDVQVTFASSDVTVEGLLRALHAVGVDSRTHDGMTSLYAADPAGESVGPPPGAFVCLEAQETRVFRPVPGVPLDQLGRYFCDRLASDRGVAHVVAGRLFVRDYYGRLNLAEQVLRSLTPPASPVSRDQPDGGAGPDATTALRPRVR